MGKIEIGDYVRVGANAVVTHSLPERVTVAPLSARTTGLLGRGLGVDSVDLLRLLGAIEEEFHLTIDDSVLQTQPFQTVGSLLTFLQERLSP